MTDDIDDDGQPDLFISFKFDVKLIRVISNVMIPSDLAILASIERSEAASDNEVETALTKWRYWFDHVVAKGVCFCTDNEQALAMFLDDGGLKRLGNIIMLTPEDPSDEVLGALFQAKMNALALGHVICAAIELTSDNMHGLSFTLAGDHSNFLPKTTTEWLGGHSFFKTPWWTRNDASSIDILVPEDVDTSVTPAWAYSLDFLDRSHRAQAGTKVSVSSRTSFQPTVIDGGKPDDE